MYQAEQRDSALPTAANDARLAKSVREWEYFLQGISIGDSVLIVYHEDVDGLVAAVCLKRVLEKLTRVGPILYSVSTADYDFALLRLKFKAVQADACICLDISLASHTETLEALGRSFKKRVFVFDHHQQLQAISCPKNVTVSNPTPTIMALNNRPVPTFCFARSVSATDAVEFPNWLTLVSLYCEGVDSFYPDEAARLFSEVFRCDTPDRVRDAIRASPLGPTCNLIRAGFTFEDGAQRLEAAFNRILTGETSLVDEFVRPLKDAFASRAEEISVTINTIIAEQRRLHADDTARVVLVSIESHFDIAGPVASILRGYLTRRVIVAYRMYRDVVGVELRVRNGSTINLAAMLSEIARSVPVINSGGHPSAAGALVRASHFDTFVKILQDRCEQLPPEAL